MMLVALPGQVGDGGAATTVGDVKTHIVARKPTINNLRRFLNWAT